MNSPFSSYGLSFYKKEANFSIFFCFLAQNSKIPLSPSLVTPEKVSNQRGYRFKSKNQNYTPNSKIIFCLKLFFKFLILSYHFGTCPDDRSGFDFWLLFTQMKCKKGEVEKKENWRIIN